MARKTEVPAEEAEVTAEEAEVVNLRPVFVMATAEDGHHLFFIHDIPDTPGVVGIMLADAVRHYANAYENRGLDRSQTVLEIWELLKAEMHKPTDTPRWAEGIDGRQLRFMTRAEGDEE